MFALRHCVKKVLFSNQILCRLKCSSSYAFEPSLEPLLPLTVGELLDQCVQDSAHKTACISVHQNISKTYEELYFDANKLALSLKSIGCKKGDRIGIWAPNCYEWLLTQYATAKIGAIMINVNPGYRANELVYCLNLVECHTLICSQRFRTTNYCKIFEEISPNILKNTIGTKVQDTKLPSLQNLVMINSGPDVPESAPKNIMRFNDFININTSPLSTSITKTPTKKLLQFDDSINIQFTSGTTGHPKAATLTHHNIIQNARFVGKRMLEDLDSTQPLKVCVPNPLYHCFGSVLGTLLVALNRGTLVLPAPAFNAYKTLEAIHNFSCDIIYGTPTMYIDILNSHPDKFNTKSLIRGLMSGAPCPPPLIESLKSQIPNLEILIPYGSTESSPVVTLTSIHDSRTHRFESVGRPLDHLEIKVIDPESGQTVGVGVPGEVCSRGHCNFVGYWNQLEKTNEVLDTNRWYHSGDIGSIDESGYVYINGRIKDMIIRGGENIYPKEIEDFLMSHPEVADAQVIGIPDKRLGEELVAYIKLKTNGSLNSKAIKQFCNGKISHFKIPNNINFVDDFPRTVTGKVQKFMLRQLAEKTYFSK